MLKLFLNSMKIQLRQYLTNEKNIVVLNVFAVIETKKCIAL